MKELNLWLKDVRNQVKPKEWWEVLRLKVTGHFRYYGGSGNLPRIRAFYSDALKLFFK